MQHLELCFKHRFLTVLSCKTCTKTSHDTAVASYLQCCLYRHRQTCALLRVGPNERREVQVQPTVSFLVQVGSRCRCSIAKKATKIQPSLTGKLVSTERQQCLPPTGVTVPLDVGWCEEKQVKVTELFQGLVSDATDGCKIRRRKLGFFPWSCVVFIIVDTERWKEKQQCCHTPPPRSGRHLLQPKAFAPTNLHDNHPSPCCCRPCTGKAHREG